ncbi:MAG: D-glucuronyl C5-epimerase family protein [Ignavibacteriales bacterium]|nr:D-glucuronyl C5-epimerase family protein [Ignavibacteriales bacterium]
MAQGEAVSVLARATKISQNDLYEQIAIEALVPFGYDVKDIGIVNYFNSIPVYEEAPSTPKTMAVLNGFIFSLFGLYDLYLLNKDKKCCSLFANGIDSLIKLLPYYNEILVNYFLYEYPKKYYSSYTYHILVTEQLKALFIITEEPLLNEYAKNGTEYSKSFIKEKHRIISENILFKQNQSITV